MQSTLTGRPRTYGYTYTTSTNAPRPVKVWWARSRQHKRNPNKCGWCRCTVVTMTTMKVNTWVSGVLYHTRNKRYRGEYRWMVKNNTQSYWQVCRSNDCAYLYYCLMTGYELKHTEVVCKPLFNGWPLICPLYLHLWLSWKCDQADLVLIACGWLPSLQQQLIHSRQHWHCTLSHRIKLMFVVWQLEWRLLGGITWLLMSNEITLSSLFWYNPWSNP